MTHQQAIKMAIKKLKEDFDRVSALEILEAGLHPETMADKIHSMADSLKNNKKVRLAQAKTEGLTYGQYLIELELAFDVTFPGSQIVGPTIKNKKGMTVRGYQQREWGALETLAWLLVGKPRYLDTPVDLYEEIRHEEGVSLK